MFKNDARSLARWVTMWLSVKNCYNVVKKMKKIGIEDVNNIHAYHSRFISEGVAETSQLLNQETHIFTKITKL
jgi:hypothetical protein